MTEPRDDFEERFARLYEGYLDDGVRAMDADRLTADALAVSRPGSRWPARVVLATTVVALAGALAVAAIRVPGVLPIANSRSETPRPTNAVTGSCPVTKPDPAFGPPSPYPSQPFGGRKVWYGTSALWTFLDPGGETWSGLSQNPRGLTEKTFWFSTEWPGSGQDPLPSLFVSGNRLDGPGSFTSTEATNAESPDFGEAMLVGIEIPTAGCWQITGRFGNAELSYTVLIPPSAPPPSATPSQNETAHWPTARPTDASVPLHLDLANTGFWTLETPLTKSSWTLRVGTLDGRVTRSVELLPETGPLLLSRIPQPVGPAGGRVLYVSDDGHTATVHVVDVATGADSARATTDAFIPQLAIDQRGQSAFFLALDRVTGAFEGVYEVDTTFGQPHVLFDRNTVFPAAIATLVDIAPFVPQLSVSDDGNWLAYAGCTQSHCDLTAMNLADSEIFLHDREDRGIQVGERIIGVVGNLLIAQSDCGIPACDGVAIDLRTGVRWPFGGPDQPFYPEQIIAGPHGPVALADSQTGSTGRWHVRALDLTDRSQTNVFSASYEFGRTVVQLADPFVGAELPAGWFLVYRNADAAPAPRPDYSAAQLGGAAETKLPVMTFPH